MFADGGCGGRMGKCMNKRQVGAHYEQAAARYLEQQGYRIIESNFRCRYGEIDLVAREGAYLVFVEVKYRKDTGAGEPLEAVDYRKQRQISRTAFFYLLCRGYGEDTPCRFDVAAILGEEMRVIKNAFDYVP